MSTRRPWKRVFLAANPICCFCGGVTPSAQPDHVPSRIFFEKKQWPEGYIFPACASCNSATKHDEQAVAMLSRIYPVASTDEEQQATFKLMLEVQNNHPDLYLEMRPSVRQLRTAQKQYGLTLPEGMAVNALPVMSVAGPLVNGAVEQFSRKLFIALFYKHTGQILGPTGGIAMRWFTNLQIQADEIDRAIANVTPFAPALVRNAKPLGDQFFYRWGVTDTNRMGAFLAFFRQTFAILGVVAQDAARMPDTDKKTVLRPFPPPSAAGK